MKKFGMLTMTVLATALSLSAQNSNQMGSADGAAMTGWICSSKCVLPGDHPSCDQNCTKTGDPVFVDEQGKVIKISEKVHATAQQNMGKHVKMMGTMDDQDELQQLQLLSTY